MVPQGSNSGIYIMGEYEIQVCDSRRTREAHPRADMGAIYTLPLRRAQACKAPGEWQSYRIRYRALCFDADGKKVANARIEEVVFLNDVVIQKDVEAKRGRPAGSLRIARPPRVRSRFRWRSRPGGVSPMCALPLDAKQ